MKENCILFGSVTRLDCLELYEDIDDVASYLREIAHQNNGRFHWIDNQGTFLRQCSQVTVSFCFDSK